MRGKRLAPVLVVVVGFLAAFVDPVAASGYQSITEQYIRDLNNMMLAAALPITLLVEGILIYTVWKFRNSDEAKPTKENRRLEITWTVATAVVLLFVGVAAYGVMGQSAVTATGQDAQAAMAEEDSVTVTAEGVQWYWNFEYADENLSTTTSAGGDGVVGDQPLVLPADTKVVIRTESSDVIHAFHAPDLGLKADALPGQQNYIITDELDEGTYQLYCAEFCGVGHSQMLADIEVVDRDTYEDYVEDPENTSV
ncbi:cytochrome c oxidase subunit II [Halobacterium jilantaiense]|uniref:cytochrome-c oxidase n=1 Tax=Halobacterium jilantaiense TaxID=355548 RepID=A0A1I0NF96_9EURY|nr:cytochrome c oxidase subunit II [Halobacterium jilantaiense]SEV99847.1 cytochrome c oxidase subunit 2 [Halobacterium jilantaiense]